MQQYIWQLPDWQEFNWQRAELLPLISQARLKQGQLIARTNALWDDEIIKVEAIILEKETIKTAQIEGKQYNPESVRSSIHRRLGLDYAGLPKTERQIDGLVEVLLDATKKYQQPLDQQRLFSWHAALFPTGYSGLNKIKVGRFRTGVVQVVSGSIGKEKIHYQAPAANKVPLEMKRFLHWWKETEGKLDGIIRAGLAHFYFVTIHPFADGNGRIARVLTDMALAQDDALSRRYYSFSNEIVKRRKEYYQVLQTTQTGETDLTLWLKWFIKCFTLALSTSEVLLQNIFAKTEFWQKHHKTELNSRQRKVINKLLDAGHDEFVGGLNTRKYVAMVKVSRRTAVREIQDLVNKKILKQNSEKGRSVSYNLVW